MIYLLLILSVFLGGFLVILWKPNTIFTRLLLAFSGAYLLSVTILHLLPELYSETEDYKYVGILILSGIIIQFILESFSKGAEHGHIHVHNKKKGLPILLFVSLCVHAFSEGLPIHNSNENLLWAIVVHKIPIAIVLTTFLLNTKYKLIEVIAYLSIFSIMSPLGVLLAEKVDFLSKHYNEITAVIIGVFLHISTVILFESTENHKFNLRKFTVIILGVLLALVTL